MIKYIHKTITIGIFRISIYKLRNKFCIRIEINNFN